MSFHPPPDVVAVGVILAAVFTLLLSVWDRWHNPSDYEHLALKNDKRR